MNNFNPQQQQHLQQQQIQTNGSNIIHNQTSGYIQQQSVGTPPGGFQNPQFPQLQQQQLGIQRQQLPQGMMTGQMQNMSYTQNQTGMMVGMGQQQQPINTNMQFSQNINSPGPATPLQQQLQTHQIQPNNIQSNTTELQPVNNNGNNVPQNQSQLQQQQQQLQQGSSNPNPQRDLNVASFCRLGQETIQELVNKTNEMFGCLKSTQPPDGKQFPQQGVDRKQKLHETLRGVKALVKRLRIIYDKMEEVFPSSETNQIDIQSLIPYTDADDEGMEEDSLLEEAETRKNTEAYRQAMEEYHEVVEQVTLKNRHLKETIDQLRQICWDVNTMLAMRKD